MSRRQQDPADPLRALLWVWILLCVLMGVGALLRGTDPRASWARWEAAARRAEQAHLQQLQLQAERNYTAWQQLKCGPETGVRTRADGSRVCTDKTGRRVVMQLAGANP